MAETHETIADIIAEMRGFKRYSASDSSDCRYVAYWLYQTFADRLEAAHRRERGDCAKLREALVRCRNCAQMIPQFVQASRPERSFLNAAADYAILILQDVADGLAAPPRNCDIAQDWLHDLYVNFKPPASVKREIPPEWVDAVMAFCRWLVAPATEKEGGNDGR